MSVQGKKSEAQADDAPGEVPPLPSPGALPDRIQRIANILDRIERLNGTPDQATIIEDERANLEKFTTEGLDAALTAKIKSVLK